MTLIEIFIGFIAVAEVAVVIMNLRDRGLLKNIEILQHNIDNLQLSLKTNVEQLNTERASHQRELEAAAAKIVYLEAQLEAARKAVTK